MQRKKLHPTLFLLIIFYGSVFSLGALAGILAERSQSIYLWLLAAFSCMIIVGTADFIANAGYVQLKSRNTTFVNVMILINWALIFGIFMYLKFWNVLRAGF